MHTKLLTIFFIGSSLLATAQKFTNSPFSSYGLGEVGGLDHALFSAMGNNTVSIIDSTVLNFYNPSSYASLGKGQPLFSTGISSRFSEYSSGNDISNSKYIGIDHFVIGIPFAKRFGLAFGLKPFSRTGYEFYQLASTSQEKMKYIYKGSGGTHDVFTGLSVNVLKLRSHTLGIGGNFGYLFGSTINERISYLDAEYASGVYIAGGVENRGYTLKSFHMDFGLNYSWAIGKYQSLVVGAIYTPTQNLQARRNEFMAYSTDVYDPDKYQYLDTIISEKGQITMPSTFGLGVSYTMGPKNVDKKTRIYQLTFTGEFKMTNWSQYQTRFNAVNTHSFSNTTRFGLGIQYVPHHDYRDRAANVGYMSRIRYRAGFQYSTLPIKVQNDQQTNMGVTLGFGLPFAIQRSSSSLNFGVVLGKQGTGSSQSVNERYIGINFGLTISPGLNDRWFKKFKID